MSLHARLPLRAIDRDTAGLKLAPEQDPKAKIITVSVHAILMTPKVPVLSNTLYPTAATRKNVPRNSATYALGSFFSGISGRAGRQKRRSTRELHE